MLGRHAHTCDIIVNMSLSWERGFGGKEGWRYWTYD